MRYLKRGGQCSVDGCTDKVVARRLCGHHYYSSRHGWTTKRHFKRTDSLAERFERHVERDPNSGCWLWAGTVSGGGPTGYGTITFDKTIYKAHRLSVILSGREIPAGKFVCHACDTPLCVNPAHLWIGSHADNMADMAAKGRHVVGRRPRGTEVKNAKLNRVAVLDIRSRLAAGCSKAEISRAYGVTRHTVILVAAGKTWSHVQAEVKS